MSFPTDFIWGAASSAYQIEGASTEDGKGPSIWDMFTRNPDRIWEGHTGDMACDHYHRYKSDVALLAQLGLKAYRFSISWPRIFPEGTGTVNEKGLAFYEHLVDTLLAHGIQPWVTLYQWDYPYELFLRGGWLNRESPRWFAEYATLVVKRLSDRVGHWVTLHEPQGFIGLGYHGKEHAPGLGLNLAESLLAGHHCLMAHGRAVQAIREHARSKPSVGWSSAGASYSPATSSPEDLAAARRAILAVFPDRLWNNCWWGEPVVFGHYPEEGLKLFGSAVPKHKASDFTVIQQPLDFYGCSIFQGLPVRADRNGQPIAVPMPPGTPDTHFLWKQTPDALYWGPKVLGEHYKLPIIITENGLSSCDMVSFDGRVHDQNRIDFMNSYLIAMRRALREGVDIRGYFAWSALDCFEWSEGYKHRFGLIHVDFETQTRTIKDSGHWYRTLIESNGAALVPSSPESSPPHYAVKEAKRYIQSHLDQPFNIKDLATHLNCHPDFLSRKFKQDTGMELSHYIRDARIQQAKELLRNPKMSIDLTAEKTGFTDRIHFSKVFRRVTGIPPGQYQRQFRHADEKKADSHSLLKLGNPRSRSG